MQELRRNKMFHEKFDHLIVNDINKSLVCKICESIFLNPVINVKCGHTFCKGCLNVISGIVKCPLDSDACKLESVVANRLIQDQINDIQVYCKFSRSYSNRFSNSPNDDGCKAILNFGSKSDHENNCEYSWVDCPNDPKLCGKIWKNTLNQHADVCLFCPCPNSAKGCIFRNTKDVVDLHVANCLFKDQEENQAPTYVNDDIAVLKTTQREMMIKLNELTKRIEGLENSYNIYPNSCSTTDNRLSIDQRKVSKLPSEPLYDELDSKSLMAFESSELLSILNNPSKLSLRNDSWTMPFQFNCVGTIKSHQASVTSISLWKRVVLSSDAHSNIKMWSLDELDLGCQMSFKAGIKKINMITVNKDHLYSAGEDQSINCWFLVNMTKVSNVENAHDHNIMALVCSDDILFSSSYTVIKVWHCESLIPIHTITGLHHWVKALSLNAKKDKLYSGSHSTVNVWKADQPFELVGEIKDKFGSVHSLVVSNKFIIVGTYNKNIHAYDVNTLLFVHHFTGHVGAVNCMVLSPVHKFFVTGSSDSTLLLWCLEKMLPVQTLQRHKDSVNCVAVCGDTLLSGSSDTEVKVFKVFKL